MPDAESDQWIVVRNWEKFQHYKDAWPVWIKFHTGLLHDSRFLELPESTRLLLAQLWLLYATSRAQVPHSTRWLSRQLNQKVMTPQLKRLIHEGFISLESSPCLEHVKSASSPRALAESREEKEQQRGAAAALSKNEKQASARPSAALAAQNGAAPDQEEPAPELPVVDPDQARLEIAKLAEGIGLDLSSRAPVPWENPEALAEAERKQQLSREWLERHNDERPSEEDIDFHA